MSGPLEFVLEKLGLKTESFSKIQFGQGVVGRTWPIFLAAEICLCILGVYVTSSVNQWWIQLIVICAVIVLPAFYLLVIVFYTLKSPHTALLEGATLIAYRQQELAAKGLPAPPAEPLTSNPTPSNLSLGGASGEGQ